MNYVNVEYYIFQSKILKSIVRYFVHQNLFSLIIFPPIFSIYKFHLSSCDYRFVFYITAEVSL
jgi:hypothetical protein